MIRDLGLVDRFKEFRKFLGVVSHLQISVRKVKVVKVFDRSMRDFSSEKEKKTSKITLKYYLFTSLTAVPEPQAHAIQLMA